MSKFMETEFVSTKEILKFPDHYVALAVMVDDSDVEADENGKKIVKKGTIVGGNSKSAIDNLDEKVGEKYVALVKNYVIAGNEGANNALRVEVVDPDEAAASLTIVDPGTNSAELSVTVSGKDVTVNLATSAEGVEVSTAKQVADAINASATAKVIVKASYYGVGDGVVAAKTKTTLANGGASSATGAEGVLMNDVDVTYGDKEGAMIIHGFVAADKLPYGAANADAAAKAGAILGMVKFIK